MWFSITVADPMATVVAMAAVAWKHSCWTLAGRLHYTFNAATGIGFLAWLHHWNMLGWHFH